MAGTYVTYDRFMRQGGCKCACGCSAFCFHSLQVKGVCLKTKPVSLTLRDHLSLKKNKTFFSGLRESIIQKFKSKIEQIFFSEVNPIHFWSVCVASLSLFCVSTVEHRTGSLSTDRWYFFTSMLCILLFCFVFSNSILDFRLDGFVWSQ